MNRPSVLKAILTSELQATYDKTKHDTDYYLARKEKMKIVIKADVKRYRPNELAALYGMSLKTLNRNLVSVREKIGKRKGQWYSIIQVITIFDHLDRPYKEYEIDDNLRLLLVERKTVEIKFHPQDIVYDTKQAS